SPAANRHSRERLSLEADLRHSVSRGELVLHYQPKVLLDGRISGVEALVRWNHPQLGLLPPARFVPIAEETGQIAIVGLWVLRAACAQGLAWRKNGLPAMRRAVNISPRQFTDEDLVSDLARVLDETGFPPAMLELEITENAVMHDVAEGALIL